jgi:hypothetical protein
MADEIAAGFAGAPEGGGHSQSGAGVGSPLQTRAAFVKNWDWQSVVSINRGACERGRAQHGINSETGSACAKEWETLRSQILTLGETLDRLRGFHKKAPFLFFNGNTFATIGRELAFALFSDLVPGRKREVMKRASSPRRGEHQILSPDEYKRQRRQRRMGRTAHQEVQVRDWAEEHGCSLRVLNEGHHWLFQKPGFTAEWWPRSAKLAVNRDYQGAYHTPHWRDVLVVLETALAV